MNNRYALITGASFGLGEEYARQLARRGWSCVLVARSFDRLQQIRDELLAETKDIDVRCIGLDLSTPTGPVELFEQTRAAGLEICLLVNNAGFGAFGDFASLDRLRQRQMLDLNIAALVDLSHLYLNRMIQQPADWKRTGGIINIASVAGFVPLPYSTVYAATKAFVVSFSHSLAEEARQHGVHVMVVNPGSTKTKFFETAGKSPFVHPKLMQSASQVIEESLRAFSRGKFSVTTGRMNRLNVLVASVVPRKWITAAVSKGMRQALDRKDS